MPSSAPVHANARSSGAAPRVPAAPPPSTPTARKVMLGNRSESAVERELRSALHGRGLRFRKHASVIPGLRCRPDVVFTKYRIAVFVDGCFWHRCPVHRSEPKANAHYWQPKLAANVTRDRRNDEALAAGGWTVLRFWTHEPVTAMVAAVACAVASARGLESHPCQEPQRSPSSQPGRSA